MHHICTLDNLESAGLLTPLIGTPSLLLSHGDRPYMSIFLFLYYYTGKPMFPKLRELLRLVVPEAQNGQPLDIAYTHSGFAYALSSFAGVCVVCAAADTFSV